MGVYLSIISGVVKLFNYMAAGLQHHHDEMNGAKQQQGADNETTIKTILDVTGPVGRADVEQLWLGNKAKFGPDQPISK